MRAVAVRHEVIGDAEQVEGPNRSESAVRLRACLSVAVRIGMFEGSELNGGTRNARCIHINL